MQEGGCLQEDGRLEAASERLGLMCVQCACVFMYVCLGVTWDEGGNILHAAGFQCQLSAFLTGWK